MSRTVRLRPSAKINLVLRVGAKRADGFHDVHTVLQSIALHDTLTLGARRGPFTFLSRTADVPADRTNLVWRAAELLWRTAGRAGDPRDAQIELDKQIPVGAGLGGGSADAAAALAGLNRAWSVGLDRAALIALAAELGSDVPFFLVGGTAAAAGRGEEVYPVDDIDRLGVVVIKPSFGVATADAYRWLDDDRARGGDKADPQNRPVDVGWPTGPVLLRNDFEAPVSRRHPAIDEMLQACMRQGALGAAMSGSGSAVFGLFSEPAARRAAKALERPDWRIALTRTLARREAASRVGV